MYMSILNKLNSPKVLSHVKFIPFVYEQILKMSLDF